MASDGGSEFRGIIVALVTPMTPDQQVDQDALRSMTNLMIEQGVGGIAPLGSTGEYYALSPEERQAVAAGVIEAADGRVPVVVGTNAGSTREVIEYARQAERLGAAGILLAAPYYSLPTGDELVEHICAVSGAIGISIVLYNYPARTGVDMTPEIVQRLAELDNVRYIKESTGDQSRMSEIARRCDGAISILCGCDTLAVEAFEMGAVGWVGGAVNAIPAPHVELYKAAVEQKDIAAARAALREDAPDAGADGERRKVHAVRQGRVRDHGPSGRPAAPAPAARQPERDRATQAGHGALHVLITERDVSEE